MMVAVYSVTIRATNAVAFETMASLSYRQADHLTTRANSATYADTRLIVCACKGAHGWKKWHACRRTALQ
jgi:hypothetical protein